MDFCNRLHELRKSKGMSQEELAGVLDVTRQTVSKWEVGESTPDMGKLMALAECFGVSLDHLVLGKAQTAAADNPFSRIVTPENRRRARGALRAAGYILGAMLSVDAVSLIVYMLIHGFPT